MQLGRTLQLGIEIVNQSARPVALSKVAPIMPLDGLRAVAARWGPCGSLPEPVPPQSRSLGPGATRWLTVTFRVLVKCPEPFPVLFKVRYAQAGRTMTTEFDSFPDLGQVKYNSCPTGSVGRRMGVGRHWGERRPSWACCCRGAPSWGLLLPGERRPGPAVGGAGT